MEDDRPNDVQVEKLGWVTKHDEVLALILLFNHDLLFFLDIVPQAIELTVGVRLLLFLVFLWLEALDDSCLIDVGRDEEHLNEMEACCRDRFQVENTLSDLVGEEVSNFIEVNDAIGQVLASVLAPLKELFEVAFDR